MSYSKLYNPLVCVKDEQYDGPYPGAVCGPMAKFARFVYNQIEPSESLLFSNVTVKNEFGLSEVKYHGQGVTHPRGWLFVLPTRILNVLSYADFPAITDLKYNAAVQDLEVYIIHTHALWMSQ